MPDEKKPDEKKPDEKVKSSNLRAKLETVPEKLNTAVEEGKANTLIESMQQTLAAIVRSPFEACRILSQHVVLLDSDIKTKVASRGYVLATILAVFAAIELIYSFSVSGILQVAAYFIAAFVLDRILHASNIKEEKRSPRKKSTKDNNDITI